MRVSEEAKDLIARAGYDPVYGARPLKRYIQRQLETKIGRALIAGQGVHGRIVNVTVKGGEIAVELMDARDAELVH